jgi:A/G-specific adenine glycosylase
MSDAVDAFAATLRDWHARAQRPLPWRETRDPWSILVAEVMLAQTQASRVARIFPKFIDRFPIPASLAGAPTQELLAAWSGLGYNRRAIRLQALARILVDSLDGEVPSDPAKLRALPGIGPTIAAAVAAQAFGAQVLPLDVNVRRLLHRALAPMADDRALEELGRQLASAFEPWAMVQASFDFGALVCRATPRCGDCPWRRRCAWDKRSPDPAPPRRRQSPFEGSHRQLRGQIVGLLGQGEHRGEVILAKLDAEPARFWHAWNELVREGFLDAAPPAEALEPRRGRSPA